jgi:primosomal protein N' (replication factor Y) (superfamily II helicase)
VSFAEVCVNSPAGRNQLFTYSIPPGLSVSPGCAVWVPFGSRTAQGIVIDVSGVTGVESVRPLAALIEPEPTLTTLQLTLSRWISEYYCSPLFNALSLFLPPGFARGAVARFRLSEHAFYLDESSLDQDCSAALALIRSKGSVSPKELEKALGRVAADSALSRLTAGGFIERSFDIAPLRVKPRMELYIRLSDGLKSLNAGSNVRRAPRQAALMDYLSNLKGFVSLAQLKEAGFSRPLVNALALSGSILLEERRVTRLPHDTWGVQPSFALEPIPAQRNAIGEIVAAFDAVRPGVFLLHGVTGSGKTEVYLQALAGAISRGRQGIVLVPEIALTPQTVERFAARFPGKTAVLHSGLSLGEQYDTWQDIKRGLYDVVVGARGALFAPLPRPGLIVMDEEHEWTYKQSDQSPRYHARTVALKMAELTGAPLVLGSATPDVESYFRATSGTYRLLELPERLTPHPGAPMPAVQVVDLRAELKDGNRGIFSLILKENMSRALGAGEQVILFFNRRGSSSTVQCRTCGYYASCKRCSVALSFHSEEHLLVCHQCGRRSPVPEKCPSCGSRRIRFLGLGTQKVMEEAALLFPKARLLRWDSDAARGKGAHGEILGRLRRREADVLIGTQLVAKGLDLPFVTLVGVVSADTALGLPDFRSAERTFQLLSQVAGRAGRGEHAGLVIIQTYSPENYAIEASARHDYKAFYSREIEYRHVLGNPPFSRIVRLCFSHTNESTCRREAERLQRLLAEEVEAQGLTDLSVLGPAPAFIPRLRGRYRWQIIVKGQNPEQIINKKHVLNNWVVDIDPVGL